MRQRMRTAAVMAVCVGWIVLMAASAAYAVANTGACCLPNGSCTDVLDFQCEGEGGDFIGENTSCLMIQCAAPLAVPMVSIVGLVSVVGALGGLGVHRLLTRRRHRS